MSEDNKPVEVEAKAKGDEVKTEERITGEMPAIVDLSESDAPGMPAAKASPSEVTPEPTSAPSTAPTLVPKTEEPEKAEKATESKKAEESEKAEKADLEKAADEAPARSSRSTMVMPVVADVGAPPMVPGDVEDPTHLPNPEDVPSGSPSDAAKAPGRVPSGDSRSLRAGAEFALIYRRGTAVITRFGTVGQRGQWRVVEYPTPTSASNAYAKECSRFVGEGFSDYRD
ncbi:MAG: hypothetical protein ACKV2T_18495 [Kofleriaceae bacterium]